MRDDTARRPGGEGSPTHLECAQVLRTYSLLLECGCEEGSPEEYLRRALQILATPSWLPGRQRMGAFLADPDRSTLRLVAHVPAGPAPPSCHDVSPGSCLCGQAWSSGEFILTAGGADAAARCPAGVNGGRHAAVPLAHGGEVVGVLHLVLGAGEELPPHAREFLDHAATLLAADVRHRRGAREHAQLEAKFLLAQKMEAVGRLAGGVAHDFNNILTAITSYSELGLVKLPPDHPLRRNFEEILGAADRAAILTQQLLAFSRRQILAPRALDLNLVMRDLSKLLRRLLGEDVDLEVRTSPQLGPVWADPAQVEQVIVNLAVNSRDAMPGGGRLLIETDRVRLGEGGREPRADLPPGEYACIAVSDTGVGMTEEVRRRVFEPFFTTKDKRHGTGLGLAAVYGIVRQSGGHILVDSAPGAGARFRIFLPLAAGAGAAEAAGPAGADLPRGTETILLAEDDDAVRAVVVEILSQLGYRVLEARDGADAVELAASHPGPIDLLLADVVMPAVGGPALHDMLLAKRPGLAAMFISGYTADADLPRGLAEGGAALLQKPFSPRSLALRVRQFLDRAREA